MAPRLVPQSPLTGVGVGGAFSIVLVWILGLFSVEMPMEVASSIAVLIAFAGGWLIKLRNGKNEENLS